MESISIQELKTRQANGEKLLVDFFATWCGPCKMLTPRLDNLQKSYPNIPFVKINIEDNMDGIGEYGITSVPTVIAVNGSDIKFRSVGLNSDGVYKNMLENL